MTDKNCLTSATALQEFNKDLIMSLQRYQDSLHIANQMAKTAAEDRDRAVSDASARLEAMQSVITALIMSLRPYGLDRKKFTASIRSIAQRTPTEGPKAVQHTVLYSESMRVLKPGMRT
ncbi:hypothetical protein MKK65_18880 [Methylobacterium sp. J-001]|jgi:hypothetical protein|uniref:hypothetical protein n=1 Tax=Methylobacterium sp. J-001 TaxID=2836609 RepID=UPI001FBB908D|nr:hypothetical protein [Methylobacterium sp. J-001]MCJ2118603.1 hypothetical protein [Methylobacterium sp. J-001]